jgi:hypothetical protein
VVSILPLVKGLEEASRFSTQHNLFKTPLLPASASSSSYTNKKTSASSMMDYPSSNRNHSSHRSQDMVSEYHHAELPIAVPLSGAAATASSLTDAATASKKKENPFAKKSSPELTPDPVVNIATVSSGSSTEDDGKKKTNPFAKKNPFSKPEEEGAATATTFSASLSDLPPLPLPPTKRQQQQQQEEEEDEKVTTKEDYSPAPALLSSGSGSEEAEAEEMPWDKAASDNDTVITSKYKEAVVVSGNSNPSWMNEDEGGSGFTVDLPLPPSSKKPLPKGDDNPSWLHGDD